MSVDIRWLQRFEHFTLAHDQLADALRLMAERPLSNLEKQGTIQAYELAWNVLRDYLAWQGIEPPSGSRDAICEAIADGGA